MVSKAYFPVLLLTLVLLLGACTPTHVAPTPGPATDIQRITWSEFGPTISLAFTPGLAQQVTPAILPAKPNDPQMMFALAHPALAQFRFTGYPTYPNFQLPYPLEAPQIMVYKTEDFSEFTGDTNLDFPGQRHALSDLLQTGVDSSRCTKPVQGYDEALPFLPWVNAAQAFCAQARELEFTSGRGVRYLTYYAQGVGPVLDPEVFYAFQGLTADEKYYVSAVFPVQTGVFPTDPPDCPKCSDPNYNPIRDWQITLAVQLKQLNDLPGDRVVPSLDELDSLIRSIQFE